jgi:hypothetical protein
MIAPYKVKLVDLIKLLKVIMYIMNWPLILSSSFLRHQKYDLYKNLTVF